MDFELTQEQKDIQKAVREFAQGEFDKEMALEYDQREDFPKDLWKKACELGFVGIHFDEKYGGAGLGRFENALVTEELCRGDSSLGVAISLVDFASEIILVFGTEEQKKKYLTPLTKGKAISAGAITEPDAGSDVTSITTQARTEGDEYVLNGTKQFITNGTIANYYIVLCQTDPKAEPRYRGFSTILVESDTKGFEANKLKGKLGIRTTKTAELSFNDARVPKENVIGKEGRGFYQIMEFFDESRIDIAAQGVGIAQGAFDRALKYAQQRKQFGRPVSEFQATQHKLAEMALKIETARLLTYRAGWNFDKGRLDPGLTSMAKWHAGRVAFEVADEAVQIFGGYGYMEEYEVSRFLRDAKILEIYEGTKEIQKNTVANMILGKLKSGTRSA